MYVGLPILPVTADIEVMSALAPEAAAPNVLRLMVTAADPLNVCGDAPPVPEASNVTELATLPAWPVVFWFNVGTSAA